MLNYLYTKEVIKFQMCSQIIRYYWRSTYRQYIKINNVIRPYSYIPHKEENNVSSQIIKSVKYPEHQLVYAYPRIVFIRVLNILKRNVTVLGVTSIPIIIALQVSGLILGQEAINLIFSSLIIIVLAHVNCYVCNNFIGSIYLKKDNQEVIISYSNYWGKRIDLKTNINSVIPLTETPLNVCHSFYRNLNVISHKQKLKISIKHGRIIDKTEFQNIVGDIS